MLLEAWRAFEAGASSGAAGAQAVERRMPKRIKRKRPRPTSSCWRLRSAGSARSWPAMAAAAATRCPWSDQAGGGCWSGVLCCRLGCLL